MADRVKLTEMTEFGVLDDEESGRSPAITSPSSEGIAHAPRRRRVHRSVLEDGFPAYLAKSLRTLLVGEPGSRPWLNLCMLLTPFAIYGATADWSHSLQFILALLAIAPFAERLGFITEQLALHTNDTLGGLLNATFGNATELIVAVLALNKDLLRVVQVSLLGSVLSNLLLVLGSAFFLGGLRHSEQRFNKTASSVNSGLLLLGTMCLMFPAVMSSTNTEATPGDSTLALSRFSSVVLLLVYVALLVFQLKTHQHLFEGESDDEEDEEERVLGFWGAIVWLGIITVFISFLSEILVGAIEGASDKWGVSTVFVATILIPIVGNAAEHASAIIFAMKNKMEITVGVAIGSSTQISVFVLPLLVVIAWGMDKPLSLDFHLFETATITLSVITASIIISKGRSNWMSGLLLIVAYLVIAAGYYVHRSDDPDPSE